MRRFMSLIMVLCLVLGIVPALAQEAPRTVTIGSASVFLEDWLEQDVMQILQRDLNVKIEYTFYDQDKFNLMLAGGDLPDIVIGLQQYLPTIIQNQMAMDLDTVKDRMPHFNGPIFQARNELMRNLLGGSEKQMLFVAPGLGPERVGAGKIPGRGYTIRWDYYKEIGAPAINNDDDYLKAFVEIAKLHPTHADGTPMYAIGHYNDLFRFYMRAAYLKPVALNPWTFNNYLYMAGFDDCVLYNGYINPERSAFWTDMAFYNKLHREGLFDLDSFTMTYDNWIAKVRGGHYLGEIYNYNVLYNEQVKNDPETLAGNVVIPSEGALVHASKLNLTGNAPTNYLFISKNAKNMDAAIDVIDYLHDPDYIRTVFTGVKGSEWDYDANGVPYMFEETIKRRAENGAEWQKTGFGRSTIAWWNMCQPTAHHPDGYSYDLMEEPAYRALGLSPLYKDYDEFYDVVYPGAALMKVVEEGKTIDLSTDYAQTVSVGINEIPMDIKRIMDACNDVIYRAMPKLVMAKDDAEFAKLRDQVIEDIKAVDEATAWAWCEKEFNRVKEIVTPAYEQGRQYYLDNYQVK